jgi:xanthine dehydrogenase large subunit
MSEINTIIKEAKSVVEESKTLSHDSGTRHVTGEAVYINDIDGGSLELKGRVVYSPYAHAKILSFDLSEAKKMPGVHAVLSCKDIPGANQMGPVVHDEYCLADGEVFCVGQAVFLIAAETDAQAIAAEKKIKVEYQKLDAILDIETAIRVNSTIGVPRKAERGNPDEAMLKSPHKFTGTLRIGGQEHWYLETQSALCVPGEEKEMMVFASSQNPSETQAIVAEVLGVPFHEVVCEVKRMGGAFGGKETNGNHVAAWAALLAFHTKKPVKIHLFRDDDQKITGKRHRFLSNYEVGFDDEGRILSYILELNADAGIASDLSMSILERAVFHADNAYWIPNMRVNGKCLKTNLPSNTAFRGFGGPQGIAVIEHVIDRIARFLSKEPAEIRKINFYQEHQNNTTHYGQLIENNRIHNIYDRIIETSEYFKRRKEIELFNNNNEFVKKGLALTPVKFGISFTASFLNQAGALVHVYKDGTIQVNHGGTEMGQGLHAKMQSVAAAEMGVSPIYIKVTPTNTSKVPNTSATAASTGSDLNGQAVKDAVTKIKKRMAVVAAYEFSKDKTNSTKDENIVFKDNFVFDRLNPVRKMPFVDLVTKSYFAQVSLSATGYYRTPDIGFSWEVGKGRPFYYFSYGIAIAEVELDILTARHKVLRVDILHDAGDSLNPALDIGQIEGAFVQGMGWCTTEDLKWDNSGNLMNHSPDTYKIPSIKDIPIDFRVELLDDVSEPGTIRGSKAVGEPPLMHGFSVWLAIKDAISATAHNKHEPMFALPATNELILQSLEDLKMRGMGNN